MADANCATTYTLEVDCCSVDLATPPVEPEPPEEPPPTTGSSKFSFEFAFGDSLNPIVDTSRITGPSPYAGIIKRWKARNANDEVATANFLVYKSTGITGALIGVGGTQPSISAAVGAMADVADWDLTVIAIGDCLEVQYASGDSQGATLVIECETT